MIHKKSKIAVLYFLILLCMLILSLAFWYRSIDDRVLVSSKKQEKDTALMGSIITSDGFSVAKSRKLYQASINTEYLNPSKKELFIKLYTIYSGDDPKIIRDKINSKQGYVVLSKELDARAAAYLRQLSRKMYNDGIFIPKKDKKTGKSILQSLDIVEISQTRDYVGLKALTPVIGYINSLGDKKGIENFYAYYLEPISNGLLEGASDLGKNVIIQKTSGIKNREDGYDVHLGISLKLQVMLEKVLDEQKEFLQANEIVAAIMQSGTGQIVAMASSNRFNPSKIKKGEEPFLDASVAEKPYEPGSVIKPFIFSLLLEHGDFNRFALVNTHNGQYKLGKRTIVDTHPAPFLSAEDVIVYSSNIGMVELSSKLKAVEIYNGLLRFGFSELSGIDLPAEARGRMPSISKLEFETYRGALSYGYGLNVTFMQLLKAFNAFNNKGIEVTPHIASYISKGHNKYPIEFSQDKQVISQQVAKIMKRILIKTAQKGTAQKAQVPGIEVGGKTGTAHIAEGGGYSNRYNASFFGFANDEKGNRYTIGVFCKDPQKKGYYFGSLAALPTFKKAVELLIENGYLYPSLSGNLEQK